MPPDPPRNLVPSALGTHHKTVWIHPCMSCSVYGMRTWTSVHQSQASLRASDIHVVKTSVIASAVGLQSKNFLLKNAILWFYHWQDFYVLKTYQCARVCSKLLFVKIWTAKSKIFKFPNEIDQWEGPFGSTGNELDGTDHKTGLSFIPININPPPSVLTSHQTWTWMIGKFDIINK